MDDDHGEMGRAGGKSLLPAFSRGHLEDGGDNQDVGDEDQHHGQNKDTQTDEQSDKFFDGGVSTSQLH